MSQSTSPNPSLFSLLRTYRLPILGMLALAMSAGALALVLPRIVQGGIDAFEAGTYDPGAFALRFLLVVAATFVLAYGATASQTLLSERVARDLRASISEKLSRQSHAYVQHRTAAYLLTVITSDVDAVKQFVSMVVVTMTTAVFMIVGAGVMLLSIDRPLGFAVLAVIPVIVIAFTTIFRRIGPLFLKVQKTLDRLNKAINESILGAALVRILRSQPAEKEKFAAVNADSKALGMSILRLFGSLIPVVTFLAGVMTLIILALGGTFVVRGTMTLGGFVAFNSYAGLLIFPIMMIGFMSNLIGRAAASYGRITGVTSATEPEPDGGVKAALRGDVELRDVSLLYGERTVLRDVSFTAPAGTSTAIIGPTAAGKTQLLYLLTGLLPPNTGEVLYDGRPLRDYDGEDLHAQIGFVFQDGVVFNMSIRDNIAFSGVTDADAIDKAVRTAELQDFVDAHPDGLDAMVSERGTSLSGGQKQRLMLARALASSPRVLLLDDFTARVDPATEARILASIAANYPRTTVISVTQKVTSARAADRIVLLMEGEVLAQGTHDELMASSPEYVQIDASQRSVDHL
jgi:ATP-binding cassette subfamily B protein